MTRKIVHRSVYDENGNLIEDKQFYASFREELRDEIERRWALMNVAAFGEMPTNIEEFRARIDIDRALRLYMRTHGFTTAEIDALAATQFWKVMKMFWLLYLEALWYDNWFPGITEEEFTREEPVPDGL